MTTGPSVRRTVLKSEIEIPIICETHQERMFVFFFFKKKKSLLCLASSWWCTFLFSDSQNCARRILPVTQESLSHVAQSPRNVSSVLKKKIVFMSHMIAFAHFTLALTLPFCTHIFFFDLFIKNNFTAPFDDQQTLRLLRQMRSLTLLAPNYLFHRS